jgi:hypothetical protein
LAGLEDLIRQADQELASQIEGGLMRDKGALCTASVSLNNVGLLGTGGELMHVMVPPHYIEAIRTADSHDRAALIQHMIQQPRFSTIVDSSLSLSLSVSVAVSVSISVSVSVSVSL